MCRRRKKVDLVRVEKSQRQLQLVGGGQILRSYAIALGGDPVGHKHREGDERTPEGRYVLDWRNPNSVAHKSIHISYPNADDLAAARARGVDPGGFIMIHGQPNDFGWMAGLLQMVDWTDGCIAVTDSDMDEIWTMVADGTPIEITK
jgi:murein L,D-transpeptidase YafK